MVDGSGADAQLLVDDGWVVEDDVPLAHGGAVVVHKGHGPCAYFLRQLGRVGDGGRAADKARVGSVKAAKAQQPSNDVGHIGSEHAPIDVYLVDHDDLEVFEQAHPFGVVGQDAVVEHVRIGHHDMAGRAHRAPGGNGRIPVVGEGLDALPFLAHKGQKGVELGHLIGRQGLGGEKKQSPG